MANNNLIYNAALAGAAAGAKASRWIVNSSAGSYAADRNAAVAFAELVDSAIPTDAAMTTSKAELIQAISAAVLQSKAIETEDISASTALAVVALYNELAAVLQPIAPAETPVEKKVIGYTGGAIQTIELQPIGHTAGLYLVSFDAILRTAGTGNLRRSYTYTAPTFGATSIALPTNQSELLLSSALGRIAPGTSSAPALGTFMIRSTGATAINLVLTPATVGGSPVVDIYATSMLMATG